VLFCTFCQTRESLKMLIEIWVNGIEMCPQYSIDVGLARQLDVVTYLMYVDAVVTIEDSMWSDGTIP